MAHKQKDIASEVFDYVYSQCAPSPVAAVEGRRLSMDHFEFLAEKLEFKTDDLSLFVLAFALNCTHTNCKFDITEGQFVNGLASALGSSDKPLKSDGYAAAFRALRKTVLSANEKIKQRKDDLVRFNQFLYQWCLRSNKGDDRTQIAVELWQQFYTDVKPEDGKSPLFLGYAYFKNISAWVEFVGTADFTSAYGVSADLWQQLLEFSCVPTYEKHDPDGAWPLAIDTFVEWFSAKSSPDRVTNSAS